MVARKILNEIIFVMFWPKILGFLAILGLSEVEGWKSSSLDESIVMTSGESIPLLVVDFGGLLFFFSFTVFSLFPRFLSKN